MPETPPTAALDRIQIAEAVRAAAIHRLVTAWRDLHHEAGVAADPGEPADVLAARNWYRAAERAGLLADPDSEWDWSYERDGLHVRIGPDEEQARRLATRFGCRLLRRRIGPWIEVPTDEH